MSEFREVCPTTESNWRSVILFGQNVASYKFALGKSLLELAGKGVEFATLDELAVPFSHHLCEHLQTAPKQATSASSRFLDTCRSFNEGNIPKEELQSATARLGFVNVIDAFHIVQGSEIITRFFLDERAGRKKGIRLTDDLLSLVVGVQADNLPREIEGRWRLVETAWELSLPKHVLTVTYDPEAQALLTNDRALKRKTITGCREALNGYQKGKCFYCFCDIQIDPISEALADVDHFFPHTLKAHGLKNCDGVWNLVLSCYNCNRGPAGKFARIPELPLLERLHRRNSFLIDSHHPLRETLIAQTGVSEALRRSFLQDGYIFAKTAIPVNWKPENTYAPAF